MPNKNTPNGFYMFMLEEQKKIKAQTKRMPSMHEMPAICKDTWKSLSATEKAHFDTLAKQEKARQRGGNVKDMYRKDNQRQIIAHRTDPVAAKQKRRQHESQTMVKSWTGQDLLDIVFYVIDFQVMYDERQEDHHLPMELGIVSFTLRDGLKDELHTFIDPGDAPQGNRHMAFRHSENTHQIPLNFAQGDKDYSAIWAKITSFLGDSQHGEIPPLYCLSDHTEIVESCLDFLHVMSNSCEPNRLHKVYCMEDLIASLIMESGKTDRRPALSQIHDVLRQNIWDYTSSIRCSYHEETDCSYCSISIVKRYSFAAFDRLSDILDFSLTSRHVPEEPQQQFTVLPAETFSRGFGRGNRNRSNFNPQPTFSGMRDRDPSPPAQGPRHTVLSASSKGRQPVQMYAPTIDRFEIKLEDSDDDDDDDDDDEEDDSGLNSSELKSTVDQYHLRELRKPKTPSMLQAYAATSSSTAGPSLASLGRGFRGRGQPSQTSMVPNTVPPPPGFAGVRPMMNAASAPPVGASVSQTRAPSGVWANMGRGRGRGLPPQV